MQRASLWIVLIAVIIAIGAARIAATHRVFSEVLDEPVHIATGYEWLKGMPYTGDPEHPPLERALSALPALFQHAPIVNSASEIERGNAILYFHDTYTHNLAAARRGNLLFFIIAAASVAWWAMRAFGHGAALIATALFTFLPPILGHAGVATTDMAAVAGVTLAIVVLDWFLDAPTIKRGAILGIAVGIGMLTKYTFLFYFPIAALIVLIVRRKRFPIASIVCGAVVAIVIVWAGYRFEWSGIQQYVSGALMVQSHGRAGHTAYLFGQTSQHGWWYYFPVVFFFKTPLPFLILALIGMALIFRRAPAVALIPIAFMLAVLPTTINIGVRHILPIYPPLCVAAAYAAIALWQRAALRAVVILLGAWLFIGVERAHPDYLAWFNEAAGDHPEQVAADSNLDWGQDVLRLARTARKLHIDRMWILYTGNALLERHGLYAEQIRPWSPAPGWYALSETGLALDPEARRGAYRWLEDYRMRRVGKSMRLYYVPPLAP